MSSGPKVVNDFIVLYSREEKISSGPKVVNDFIVLYSREEKISSGPKVVYNFNFLDREKYSHSKKKLEVCFFIKILLKYIKLIKSRCEVLDFFICL